MYSSASSALAAGEMFYRTGKPCRRGHLVERYASSSACVQCASITRDRSAKRATASGYVKKAHHKGKATLSDAELRERKRANDAKYRLAHLADIRQKEALKRIQNRENIRAKARTPEERAKAAERKRRRHAQNDHARLAAVLRTSLANAVAGRERGGSALKLLGCSIEHFRLHLEKQFRRGMSWANWGKRWQIDHILPISSFDLSDPTEAATACHFTNLRPLEKLRNLSKKNRRELLL